MKQCATCKQWKEDDAFNWRYKARNERHVICRECQHQHAKRWYERHQDVHQENVTRRSKGLREAAYQFVREYLLVHPCVDCGEADPVVLEFHHIGEKDRSISQMIRDNQPLDKIQAEIEKCIVLCANCHRRRTARERCFFRGR